MNIFFHLSIEDAITAFFNDLVQRFGSNFQAFSAFALKWSLIPIETGLKELPPALILLAVAWLAWQGTKRVSTTLVLVGLLYLIGCFGLWEKLLQTLAIMLVSTSLAVVLGVPAGILMSRSQWLRNAVNPVLDMMQTLPTFVYMIPVLMLFGLGKVPAVIATVIYALPPLIRLTDLGIRHVPEDIVEAGKSFGCTPLQLLLKVQLPLARPSIMAGINQSVMMALGMIVIASMIGARGLGEDVLSGINNLDIGKGLQAGMAIVILAIVIDRITQGFGQGRRHREVLSRKPKRVAQSLPQLQDPELAND